eukprot:TRINITY_DN6650_c1_g1_i1.p1 TRINITY_DN6650_c1_g1~~TRINITY_DN6650_c1_g1_i1.p1  ORF type:complete len:531 (+),score=114.30 TRINITY_DN6650_c1_g1_i1:54-1595(+)
MTKSGYYQENDGGEKLKADAHFNGVVDGEARKCRDIGCALFFMLCLGGVGICTILAGEESDLDLLNNDARSDLSQDFAKVKDQKYVILVGCLCTMLLAFIWLELLKRFTKVVVYGSILAGITAVVAVGIIVMSLGKSYTTFVGACILAIAGLLLIFVFFMRKKINFSCAVIAAGCKGLQANKSIFTMVTPAVLGITFLYLLWWFVTAMYVYSVKGNTIDCKSYTTETKCRSYGCDWNSTSTCTGTGYDVKEASRWAMLYLVFMLFWGMLFLQGIARTAVSGTIAEWYFTRDKKDIPCGNSMKYLLWSCTYHFGSIALGSALIAIFKFVNWVLMKAQKGADNCLLKIVIGCVQCICGCIESIIKFCTKFAYVYIAMHGESFGKSSKSVSNLFSRSSFGKVFTSDLIANIIVHMGMFTAVGLVAVGTLTYMDKHGGFGASAAIVLIIFCCITFWIVGITVEVATDAVVVCYLEDVERNSSTRDFRGEDSYFAIDKSVSSHSQGINGHVETYGTGK